MKEGLQLGGFHYHKLIFSQNKDPIDSIEMISSSVRKQRVWKSKTQRKTLGKTSIMDIK